MDQDLQNLEIRVRKLEQMHIWAGAIIAVGAIYLIARNYRLTKQ